MKKILFGVTTLAALTFVSCSNDDIEVMTVGKKYTVTCNVTTQGLYDNFDLTTKVRDNYLRTKNMGVGVMSYLYDVEGKLIHSQTDCNFNFNPVVINCENLVEGDYTLVCVETLVNPDDDYSSSYNIVGTESLSKVALEPDPILTSVECVAVGTQKFHVSDADQSVSIIPEAIGSQLLSFYYNISKSDFIEVGIGTESELKQYLLNPALDEDEHYYYDLTDKGVFGVLGSLSAGKCDDYYNTLYVINKDFDWEHCYRTEDNEEGRWYTGRVRNNELEKGKTYYAGFYYLDKANATGSKLCSSYEELQAFVKECEKANVGDNSGTGSNTSQYHAPFYDWDKGTVSNVKAFMKDFTLIGDISADDLTLLYADDEMDEMYLYTFQNITGGLTESIYLSDKITLDVAYKALESAGMTLFNETEKSKMYASSDYRTAALVSQSESGSVMVVYMDVAAATGSVQRDPQVISRELSQSLKVQSAKVESFRNKPSWLNPINMSQPVLRSVPAVKTTSLKLMELIKK